MGESHEAQARLRYAVVTTHDRPRELQDCLLSIEQQVDFLIVVEHAPPHRAFRVMWGSLVDGALLTYEADVPNISVMWNMGLDAVHAHAGGNPYDVAVLNDDVVAPSNWFRRVTTAMRESGAAAGNVRRAFDPRMAGYAFILDGTKGLRADEQFQWWYGDDDLQRQAGTLGGIAYAGGEDVEHRYPNSTTVGALAKVAEQDAQRYKEKWG